MIEFKLLPGEKAKKVIKYENLYTITSLGRVWNHTYKRFLKPTIGGHGYLHVNLYKARKGNTYLIHRLIAIHFIPNPSNCIFINPKDGNKLNNDINNIEWVTRQQNASHAMLTRLVRRKHKSIYHGVACIKSRGKKPWRASIQNNKKYYVSKYFANDSEAAIEYNTMVKELNLDRPLNKF